MNMPTWREWLFSAKALIAALLALYIALAIPLDNPYWAMASVYVVSHPLSGATRSKAIYRRWAPCSVLRRLSCCCRCSPSNR